MKNFANLPQFLQNEQVKTYYDLLKKKSLALFFKRILDILFSVICIAILSPFYIIISICIIVSSGFPIIYKQTRITTYGREFKVYKFRTMVNNADKIGTLVTVDNDKRITKIGGFLRKYRLDELPQAFNVLFGSMTFVGTRPEVKKYVDAYSEEMNATLLLPAGITSLASIKFKDEAEMLSASDNPDLTYINEILPQKMKYNLEYIKNFSLSNDIKIIFKTITAVFK